MNAPEYHDMQGLLRFGFKHLTRASFLLLRVKNRDAARAWLATAPVTSASESKPPPARALQIALSGEGLRALGVPAAIVDGFANEYVVGMGADPNRSRRLGDIAQNDPEHWSWGAGERVPHAIVMLYANADALPSFRATVRAQFDEGFEEIASLDTAELDDFEPFGFKDGLSQPQLDWNRERPVRDENQLDYTNLACLGEFALGYPNEYGGYTDRPLIAKAVDLPRAEDAPDKFDLGRNGSYLVLRHLQQDVAAFWRYLNREANGDAALRAQLAAAMVGRTLDGEPLVEHRAAGDFDFNADPQGLRCPLGAHIRRSNPRNADLPAGSTGLWSRLVNTLGFDAAALDRDHVASTRFHRLLRRGRKYGPKLSIADAITGNAAGKPAAEETGLYFICLNANISRQFEFVQSAWLVGAKFDGLAGEGDPLLGHRQPLADGTRTDLYSMPCRDGPDMRLGQLPAFVTVRGGAYFFLPGLRALRYLATAR